ncbi:hypothetical protein Ahy_A10g049834 [Arachis hypogaea]|uniref:Ubiquitin-like protease family profile domain-containing protein n=1 Tax=Arachis hypogaea TaxID=3818 RepID=A0A445B805_ARAHY|nr:hypothetical protein Ahy_A10g049834 [Arachis hypogaea]
MDSSSERERFSESESKSQTEQAKDNAAERRKRALEMIREKYQRKEMMELSQQILLRINLTLQRHKMNSFRLPIVNLDSEQILQTQGSSTPFVNTASNTRKTTPESTVKYFRKKKIFPRKTFKTPPIYPPKFEKQGITVSLTSSVIEEIIKDDYVYEVSNKEERKDERPSFNLGISPPVSQSSQPSQLSVSQLKILEEAVVDAGATVALKFAEATTLEPTLPASEFYKTLIVCIYNMILNEIKTRRYQELIYIVPLDIVYAHQRQFLDKRKLASHSSLFVPICNGGHWWLWIADVNKKKFYVLDPVNKLPENIPDSRKKLNKFVGEIDSFRYQYGLHILLHKMNKIRDQVIWESQAIRLPKPSAALSSPYCKFTYGDLDSK